MAKRDPKEAIEIMNEQIESWNIKQHDKRLADLRQKEGVSGVELERFTRDDQPED